MKSSSVSRYSLREDVASSLTHAVGAGLSIAGLSILVTYAAIYGDAWRVVSFSVYGATLVMLYLASSFYHGFQSPRAKRVFRVLDHSAIFLLIAGTYTPFTLVTLRGAWGWTLFGLIWGMAILGILLTVLLIDRLKFLEVAVYIAMGWLIMIAIKPMVEAMPVGGIVWLILGGLAYTLGVLFYRWKRLPFNHTIWHLFVLSGSVCHFFCILGYVLPMKAVA